MSSWSGGVLRIFLGWWEFLTSFVLERVPGDNYMFLGIERDQDPAKPTFNSGDSSHYRQFARAVHTGVYSFCASLSTPGGLCYNAAMQVLS